MDLDQLAEDLAGALGDIPIRGYSEVPQQISPPVAIIGLGGGVFADSEDHATVQFGILVILSAANPGSAQKMIRDYCASTGNSSVKAAVEGADTTPDVMVKGWDAPAVITLGNIDYLGVEFTCEAVE